MKFDDIDHRIHATAPFRPGQKALQFTLDNVITPGVRFPLARSDVSLCQPARYSLRSGNFAQNTGIKSTSTADDYDAGRFGALKTYLFPGAPAAIANRCLGPYQIDLPAKLGLWLLSKNASDVYGQALYDGKRITSTGVVLTTAALTAHVDSVLGLTAGTNALLANTSNIRKGWNATANKWDGTGVTNATALLAGLPFQLRNSNDDIIAYSGGLFTAIGRPDRADIVIGVGKLDNGTGGRFGSTTYANSDPDGSISVAYTTRYVQPGLSHCCFYTDDIQDHLRFRTVEYTGSLAANPGYGDGAIGDSCYYNAMLRISTITWSAGTATVTLEAEPVYWRNGVAVPWHLADGDEVAVRGVQVATSVDNNYNTGMVSIIAANVGGDPKVFTYACSNPGSGVSGTVISGNNRYSHVVPHKMISTELLRLRLSEFMADAQITRATRGIIYIGSRMPHGALTAFNTSASVDSAGMPWAASNMNTEDVDVDPRYRNPRRLSTGATQFVSGDKGMWVDGTDAYYWNGTPGGIAPSVAGGTITDNARTTWAERGGMYAGHDDMMRAFYTELLTYRGLTEDGEWAWTDVHIGDNGWQQCEDYGVETQTCSPIGGKVYNREASQRLLFAIRRPGWVAGVSLDQTPTPSDVPLTILDWFGLVDHAFHEVRDGVSLERNDNDRALIGWGRYNGASSGNTEQAQAIVRCSDGLVLRRQIVSPFAQAVESIVPGPSVPQQFYGTNTAWGTVDLTSGLGPGVLATLTAQLDALQYACWRVDLDRNLCHDAVTP